MRASTIFFSLAALVGTFVSANTSDGPIFDIDGFSPNVLILARGNVAGHETNAVRMARGLAPLKPRFETSRTLPGRADEPSRVITARNDQPSVVCKTGGSIKIVKAGTSTCVGYIDKDWCSGGGDRFGITNSANSHLHADFCTNGANPIDLKLTNGPSSTYNKLGFVKGASSGGVDLSTSNYNYAVCTGVISTGAGSKPTTLVNSYNPNAGAESTVWIYSQSNGRLTPTWINSGNGGAATTKVVYYPTADALAVTGSVNSFKNKFSGSYEVELYYE